jgi:molybdate transport system ATP-binding protein
MTLSVDITVRRGPFDVVTAFAAAAGSTVALLGPNGAGKSTIVRALAGLEDDIDGSIELDGTDITHLAPELRPIGVVFQDLRLFPHLSAVENVAFPLRARGMARAEARARSTTLLDRLAYPRERLEA